MDEQQKNNPPTDTDRDIINHSSEGKYSNTGNPDPDKKTPTPPKKSENSSNRDKNSNTEKDGNKK